MAVGDNLGALDIDPEAEQEAGGLGATVSAADESQFFVQGQLQYQLNQSKQNMGTLGGFFGTGGTAASNIAGLVVVLSIVIVLITLFCANEGADKVRTGMLSLGGSALGFIFGSGKRG